MHIVCNYSQKTSVGVGEKKRWGGGGGGGGGGVGRWGREEIERGDGEKKESSLLVYKCDRGNGGLCPANGDGDRSPEFFPSSSSLKSTI